MSKDHTDTVIDEQCAVGGEFEDASFCKGPSDSEVCTPEFADASFCRGPSDGCELSERSARGYCPGEEGHEAERDGLTEYEPEETTTEAPVPPAETLPVTGVADFSGLALVAASLIAMGGYILRRT